MKRGLAALVVVAAVAGCAPTTTGSTIQVTSKDGLALKSRSVDFQVLAPSTLADATGKIVNADPAGLVSQGAGNLIAQGAGNLIAQGAGNRRVLATTSNMLPVDSAVVQVYDLDNKPISKVAVSSRADGTLTLKNVPDGKPLVAIARWKQNSKVFRTSAIVATGPVSAGVMLDPINHFVNARVTQILAKSGKLAKVSPDQLKAVWMAFNKADIPLDTALLADDASTDDLINFYKEQTAKLPCDDQKLVKDYMVTLGADPTPVSCP